MFEPANIWSVYKVCMTIEKTGLLFIHRQLCKLSCLRHLASHCAVSISAKGLLNIFFQQVDLWSFRLLVKVSHYTIKNGLKLLLFLAIITGLRILAAKLRTVQSISTAETVHLYFWFIIGNKAWGLLIVICNITSKVCMRKSSQNIPIFTSF